MKKTELIDIIIPISLELDWPTEESIVSEVLEQHKLYGFQKFAFAAPSGGWRSVGYPASSYFEERANLFLKVKKRVLLLMLLTADAQEQLLSQIAAMLY